MKSFKGFLYGLACAITATAFAAGVYNYFPPPGMTYTPTTGLVVGTATGGAQGAGTVNAQGLFVQGAAVLKSGTLVTVPQGGSGVGTLTGIIKGNGTSAFSPAVFGDVTALWTAGGTCSSLTFLRGDGQCVAAGGTPAGSNSQVQFNNSGSFGASANFTWDNTNSLLRLTGPSGGVIYTGAADIGLSLVGGDIFTGVTGAQVSLGTGGGASGNGGSATVQGGNAGTSGSGGSVNIGAGNGVGTNQNGGSVTISAGTDTGSAVNSTVSIFTQGSMRLLISHAGEWLLNGGSAGIAGQVIMSNGTGAAPAWQSLALTVPQGGTSLTSLTAHGVLLGEGTSAISPLVMGGDTVLRGTASADPVATAVSSCSGASNALTYNTSTHAFGCNTITSGTAPITCTTSCSASGMVVGQQLVLNKGSSTTRTSNTSPTLDPDLQITNVPVGTYFIQTQLNWSAMSGGGFQAGLTYSGTIGNNSGVSNSGVVFQTGSTCTPTAIQNWAISTGPTLSCASGTSEENVYSPSTGFTAGTTGTLGLSWAQNTSSGAGTTLAPQSTIILTRVQ